MKKKKYKKLANKWFENYILMRDKYQYDMGRIHQAQEDMHRQFMEAIEKYGTKTD